MFKTESLFVIFIIFIVFFIFNMVCFGDDSLILSLGHVLSNTYIAFCFLFALATTIKYIGIRECIESKRRHKYIFSLLITILFFILISGIYNIVPNHYELGNWFEVYYESETKELIDFVFLPEFHEALNITNMLILDAIFSLILISLAYIREKLDKGQATPINIKKTKETQTKDMPIKTAQTEEAHEKAAHINATYGKTAYILEKIVKILFRFSFVFVFFICISTISSKYLTVRDLKSFGMALFFLSGIILALKYYITLKNCDRKNKETYGKENLIILISPNNYEFSFSEHFLNPLRVFYKYDNKNLVKSLLVDGKNYTFVLYDAIRYKLIDLNQYKNIAYYIVLQGSIDELTSVNSNFEKKIIEITKKNDNFIIYHPKIVSSMLISNVANDLKKKYIYRYTEKRDVKKILDLVKLGKSIDKLKDSAKITLEYIRLKELNNYLNIHKDKAINRNEYERLITEVLNGIDEENKAEDLYKDIAEEKNRYIKYGLNVILDSFNYTECFYTLLKMSEYIIHYMALKNIIDNPNEVSKDNVREGTLYAWRECISFNKEYSRTDESKDLVSSNDLINSLNVINKKIRSIQEPSKNTIENKADRIVENKSEKDTCFFKEDICKCVAHIRNQIVAHGVLTEAICQELIYHLFNITFILIKEFEELNISIKDDEKIKHIFENEVSALYKKNKDLFLYSKTVVKREGKKKIDLYKESLNYETGEHQIIDKKVCIQKDYIYSVEEIETALRKWV